MSNLDKRQILFEYAKCGFDPAYTIETYFETFDKTQEGFVPFKLFEGQKRLIDNYENNRFNLVLKYRQAGISTVTAAYCAVKTAFAPDTNPERILILANKQETAIEFQSKIINFIKQLPKWANVTFDKSAQKHVKLGNGSEIKAVATSPDALRGYTPTILIMDEAAFIEGGQSLWSACLAAVGCLDEETYIYSDKGIVQLKDIIEDNVNLGFHDLTKNVSVYNQHNQLEQPNQGYKSEKTQMFRIKTRFGHELKMSWKHPLMLENGDWERAINLRIGNKIKFGYNLQAFGNNDIIKLNKNDFATQAQYSNDNTNLKNNLDISYLMGLFIAEGNYNKNTIAITCGDKEIQDRLLLDGYGTKPFKESRKNHYYMCSKYYSELFKTFGINHVSHASEKQIPKQLFTTSKEVIASFLSGLFDGDGCITKHKLKLSTTSKILATQVQTLLLNFGIRSRIHYSEQKTSDSSVIQNKDHITKIYEVYILSSHINKFLTEIGFKLTRKQNLIKYHQNKIDLTKINATKDEVKQILFENNISSKEYESKYRFFDSAKRYNKGFLTNYSIKQGIKHNITGSTFNEMINRCWFNNNYFYDEIVEIEEYDGWSYDLHLPETHSFNSNGFISHNTGGKIFLISTPNGLDEIYYEAYDGSISGTNKFVITHLKWWNDPRFNKDLRLIKTNDMVNWIQKPEKERTEDIVESASILHPDIFKKLISDGFKPHSTWYENMCRDMNLNQRMINQELECHFIGSGDNVIHGDIIKKQEQLNAQEPIVKDIEWDNNVWIWKLPQKGHRYILALDVSRGDSEDATGMCIIDYDTFEQVLEYHGKIPPDIAAQLVFHYGKMYNALSTFDITGGMGIAATAKLKEMNFPKNLLHYDNLNDDIYHMPSSEDIPGINFASKNRRSQIVAALEEAISRGGFKVRSVRLLNELKKFVYKNGKPDHMKGSHDDCIMALGMCLFVANTSFKRLKEADEQAKAMLNSWKVNINKPESNSEKLLRHTTSSPDPNKIYQAQNEDILRNTRDFSWLFTKINKK